MFAETCPQYLFMTKKDLDKPGLEGGKWMFSPPAREASDQEALWQALALGDLQVISSDHAPYALRQDRQADGAARIRPSSRSPNGMPGLEARLPVVFDEMVSNGRFDVSKFVEWTSTEPAKIYGLYPKKGTLAIGSDADIAIWDPKKSVTFSDKTVKDRAGYTPWKGRTVKGWPTTVLLRGEVLVENEQADAPSPAAGNSWRARPARPPSRSAAPRSEFDPKRNFGAKLSRRRSERSRCLIGASHWHLPLYLEPALEMPDVTVAGVADPNPQVVDALKAKLGCAGDTDYRELCRRVKPDLVIALGRHCDMPDAGALSHRGENSVRAGEAVRT